MSEVDCVRCGKRVIDANRVVGAYHVTAEGVVCSECKGSTPDLPFPAESRDAEALLANLTCVQTRCTELLKENRAMKLAASLIANDGEWERAMVEARKRLEEK